MKRMSFRVTAILMAVSLIPVIFFWTGMPVKASLFSITHAEFHWWKQNHVTYEQASHSFFDRGMLLDNWARSWVYNMTDPVIKAKLMKGTMYKEGFVLGMIHKAMNQATVLELPERNSMSLVVVTIMASQVLVSLTRRSWLIRPVLWRNPDIFRSVQETRAP